MQIGVVGINHKLAPLGLREALAKACQKRFALHNPQMAEHRLILLSTCNRTEVYFSGDILADTHSYILTILREEVGEDFDQKLYSFFGTDCFNHLSRVTAGFDSAILAETEIQGQVKEAYETALRQGNIPAPLHFAFQKALKVGKSTRSRYKLPSGSPTLADAALFVGESYFKNSSLPKILFIGSSHINSKIIEHFKRKHLNQITICNRSNPLARSWSEKYAIGFHPWEERHAWLYYDWIIIGTRCQEPLIYQKDLIPHRKLLLMDLSVPRNVEPKAACVPGVTLLNVDQLNRTLSIKEGQIKHLIHAAEADLDKHCMRLINSYSSKAKWKAELLKVS